MGDCGGGGGGIGIGVLAFSLIESLVEFLARIRSGTLLVSSFSFSFQAGYDSMI
jgi:hypothetical protein